jgi:hypothetical protein
MATTEGNRLRALLDRLPGRRCIGCVPGAGSYVHLELEPRKPRQRPLTNPHLSEEQRQGEAEYGLFVRSVWRLDSPEAVVCGAWDDNQADGPMLRGLERLVGETVASYDLGEPGLDLVLRFANGWSWHIFCDQVNDRDRRDNYSVYGPEGTLIVGTKSQLRHEAD